MGKKEKVPKGYKMTEVGVIPSIWDVVRLGDIFCHLKRRNKENNDNVLTISAQHGLVNQQDYFNKVVASKDRSNYFLLHKGDFAYNKSYSKGYPAGVVRRLDRYDKGIVSPLYICMERTKSAPTDENFLFHFFESDQFNDEVMSVAHEGARNHGLLNVKPADFFGLHLICPPLPEQQKIAEILTSVDETIESTRKVIAQSKTVKQGLLQELLTKGIGHTKFKDTEIGRIPAEWEVVRLEDLGPIGAPAIKTGPFGSMLKGEHFTKSGVPVITIQSLGDGTILSDGLFYVSNIKAVELDAYRVKFGDLVFSRVADIGRSVVVEDDEINYIISSNLMRIRLNQERCAPRFLMYSIVGDGPVKRQIEQLAGEIGRPVVSSKMLKEVRFLLPALSEQKEIAFIVSSVEYKITAQEKELEALQQMKKGLMQDLLTGKVRVRV